MAMTPQGVARIFTLLGLSVPDEARLAKIAGDGRSATEIRDDLLAWGKNQGGETYVNMLRSLVEARFQDAGLGPQDETRIARIVSEIQSGARSIEEVSETIASLGAGGGAPGAPTKGTGILAGGQAIQVKGKDGITRYYQVYEFPPGSGSWVSYQYNSLAQAEAALGSGFARQSISEDQYRQKALAESQAEEIIGLGGNFARLMQEIMIDAAAGAGIRDPSLAGRMASDPEMQRIMAQAIAGNWTPEQIRAEQRRTKFWTQILYPGIEAFYGKTANPEQAWANYTGNVNSALVAMGYKKDNDGSYNTQIKRMLDAGIDAETFLENAPIFMQAAQNKGFFEILRKRSMAELGKDVKFGDWFALMKGEGADEIRKIAEGAIIAYQAQQAGVGITELSLQRLIAQRDLSEAEARNVFTEVGQAMLALGETGLQRGGLSRDDIISSMAGIESGGGRSPTEVRNLVAKLARENDLFDEEKLNFYVGFTPSGTPFRPGLTALAPESA